MPSEKRSEAAKKGARTRQRNEIVDSINRRADGAVRWANSSTGRSVLAGVAATVAGLLLSRDRRVRDAATTAGQKVRETATDAAGRVRTAATDAADKVRTRINERGQGREVGDDLAEPFEVPTTARTDNAVIAH